MSKLHLILLPWLLPYALAIGATIPLALTSQETQWIQAHPMITANTIRGHHKNSIESETANIMQKKTGLKIKLSELTLPLERMVQLPTVIIGADSRALANEFIQSHYIATIPYKPLIRVYVTRNEHPLIYQEKQLQHEVLGELNNSCIYGHCSQTMTIKHFPTHKTLLSAILNGTVNVGILPREDAIVMLPQYPGLVMAGYETITSTNIILVRKDESILYSILNKTLQSMTAREFFNTTLSWQENTGQDIPALANVWKGYKQAMLTAMVLLMAMTLALVLIRKAYQAKKESEAVKSKFLAMMSHELRTPLGVILTANELLQNTQLNQHQHKLLQQAQSAGANLMELLNNVLDISRIEAQQIELEARSTALSSLLQELYEQYQPLADEKQIKLTLSMDNLPPSLLIDDIRLKQVIRNLISNALKFTEQGFIKINAQYLNTPLHQELPGKLHITVSDSGIGIPVDRQPMLFQPFIQVDASTTRRYGGSGLGLSICKEIIELMGGRISLTSKLGQGSQFDIVIPVNLFTPAPAPSLPPPTSPKPSGAFPSQALVLLVEDHPANQEMISAQVRALGLQCQIANDGPKALRALAMNEEIELVLMDCHLPEMDGYQVSERIRIQERLANKERLPIIAISANTGDLHRKQCLASGMDAILSKPLQLASLQTLLWMWLPSLSSMQKPTPAISAHPAETSLWQVFIDCNEEDYLHAAQALAQSDWKSAIHHVHRIKGAARTMQAQHIAQSASELETALEQHTPDALDLLQALRKALDHFTSPSH
ncbi:ATP-binding protein [Chromobacterium vaccinii]|uniref:histidine kinase n=1 Tax=Chromobacterium vaccinii TaxID=1108595 RepID=A0ABV0FF78_9NEIS